MRIAANLSCRRTPRADAQSARIEHPAGDKRKGSIARNAIFRVPFVLVRAISSAGEHCLHTAGVAGSNPASPTKIPSEASSCTHLAAPCGARNPQVPFCTLRFLRAARRRQLRTRETLRRNFLWLLPISQYGAVRCSKSSLPGLSRGAFAALHSRSGSGHRGAEVSAPFQFGLLETLSNSENCKSLKAMVYLPWDVGKAALNWGKNNKISIQTLFSGCPGLTSKNNCIQVFRPFLQGKVLRAFRSKSPDYRI